jgi:hypothetical protein
VAVENDIPGLIQAAEAAFRSQTLSRRTLLRGIAGGAASLALVSCGGAASTPTASGGSATPAAGENIKRRRRRAHPGV